VDRFFWTTLRSVWSRWADVLIIVKLDTVVGWHRAGFRLFWKWRSRRHGGRPKTTAEIRALIRRLAEENPTWGAPKVHGELQKLGLVIFERSVARYLRMVRRRGEANIEETLSYLKLPRQHHKHMKSTNMLERLMEELKRRTLVVRIFPNSASCLRLVRALTAEIHDGWIEADRYLDMSLWEEHKRERLRALSAVA
jgi:hypothetical protein